MCAFFPGLVIFVLKPPFVFPRYFLIIAPFVFIGFGILAERIKGKFKWIISAVCALIIMGNLPDIYQLENTGRGEYASALENILLNDSSTTIRIGTDADFMGEIVLENAIACSSMPQRFKMIKQPPDDTSGLILISSIDYLVQVVTREAGTPPDTEMDGQGNLWNLIYSGKNPPFSGWNFFIYKKYPK